MNHLLAVPDTIKAQNSSINATYKSSAEGRPLTTSVKTDLDF